MAAAGTAAAAGGVTNMAKISETASSNAAEPERDGSQDNKLTKGEIKALEDAGIDVHELKGGRGTGKLDLYKDRQGNIYVKPKGGQGPGEATGMNINDYKKR